jgi:hypothetical protein
MAAATCCHSRVDGQRCLAMYSDLSSEALIMTVMQCLSAWMILHAHL